MDTTLEHDLRELIVRRRILVVVGAGVSIGATKNAEAASWSGLLKLGAARCRELNPSLDGAWETRLKGEITSGDMDDTLSAAEKISRKLHAPRGGEFRRWLRETVGSLQLHDSAVLDALRDLQVPLATTNYDDLLERATKLPAITWREQARVSEFLRGERQAILHLHGYWDEPESVVLGIRSYEEVRQDSHAQAVIRALAMTQSLLFVGCGEGLSDPNFLPFLSWLREVNASNTARDYRLALRTDVVELQKQHPPVERIFVLPFGDQHEDLAGFLRGLQSATPVTVAPESGSDTAAEAAIPAAPLSPAILEYLRRLETSTSRLQLVGLGQGVQIELPIEQAYIPINVLFARGLTDEKQWRFDEKQLHQRECVQENVLLSDIFKWAARFDSRGVLLLGDPGAGKTTGARQFCYRALKETHLPQVLGLPVETVPVFLRLRNLAPNHLKEGLASFITDFVAASALPPDLANPGRDLIERKGVLWVFDGLDEVVNEKARVNVCEWFRKWLEERPDDFILVTSRYQGYQGPVDLGPAFCQFHVQPLSPNQIADFVEHWYHAVFQRLHGRGVKTAARADRKISSLNQLLRQPEYRIGRLRQLPANPLMLTILCVVHHQDSDLPRRRADLYARCVRVLVEHWRKDLRQLQQISGYDPEAAESVLASVAWGMHGKDNRTTLTVEELGALATGALADLAPGAGLGRDGLQFIRRMRDESGILVMWSAGQCGFLHLTFQEYLAGLHAAREGRAEELVKHIGQGWWREVILLAVAIGSRDFSLKFFRELLQTDAVSREGVFVDQCLDEARYAVIEPFLEALRKHAATPERQLDLLRRLKPFDHADLLDACRELTRSTHPDLRSLASEILQRAGIRIERQAVEIPGAPLEQFVDPRTGIAFIKIPAGEFDMGTTDLSEREEPVHGVRISKPFLLGKYPVTNAEYQRFLETAPKAKPPDYWNDSQFNDPQQPVVGVSWEDAQAFCQWAGCCLPTEAEWEYACRAGSNDRYCFGDDEAVLGDYAWYGENSGEKIQPVGQKKPNQWGLHDMHGNVWEWCQDWFASYREEPVTDPTGPLDGKYRVLRGGSWLAVDPANLYSASRLNAPPDGRGNDGGFRCVSGVCDSAPR